jgi:hypothetical protein
MYRLSRYSGSLNLLGPSVASPSLHTDCFTFHSTYLSTQQPTIVTAQFLCRRLRKLLPLGSIVTKTLQRCSHLTSSRVCHDIRTECKKRQHDIRVTWHPNAVLSLQIFVTSVNRTRNSRVDKQTHKSAFFPYGRKVH